MNRETRQAYDAVGHLTKTIFADPDDGGPLTAPTTSSTFDSRGRVESETDEMGLTKQFEYDSTGRLTAVVLPAVPDPEDLDANGNPKLKQPRYEYEYDQYGDRTLIRDPKGRETTFTFDEQGRQLTRKLPNGLTEEFRYDSHGRQYLHIDFQGAR